MHNSTPILLLASERSGTNLLRAIMSSHSQIASPSPFSMVDALGKDMYKYATSETEFHIDELIEDAITLTQGHLNPWPQKYKIGEVKDKLLTNSFWDIFKALNEVYTQSEKKKHWFSKEPGLFRHIYELALHMPEAKFVYLVRDPRDVVSSMVRGGIHEQNVYKAAIRWKEEQKMMLNALSDPLLKERIFMISYEELLQDQKDVIKKLMAFLGIRFEEKQLNFFKDKSVVSHSQKSEFWKNLSKPIDRKNTGKYKNALPGRQIKYVESICWNEMKWLNYDTENEVASKIPFTARVYYRLHARIKRVLKNLSLSKESLRQKNRRRGVQSVRARTFTKS